MSLRNLILVFVNVCLLLPLVRSNRAGIRAAVRRQVILDSVQKFFPLIMSQISDINIPDQHISIPLSFLGNLDIYITSIHFNINPLATENVGIELYEPNLIAAITNNVSGSGHMNIKFDYLVSETDSVDIRVNRLNIKALASVGSIESQQETGKHLPFAKIEGIDLDLDFDFDIHGKIIANIVSLVKSKIKDLIFRELKGILVDAIKSESDKALKRVINQLPLYINIIDGIAIDYSIETDPKIKNDFLILSINGGIIDLNNQETKNVPFPLPENLPDYLEQGKNGQVILSEYCLLTALRTLYLTDRLSFRLKSDDIPSSSPIKLDTTMLDWLLPGIEKMYGSGRKVDLLCTADKNKPQPVIGLYERTINGTISVACGLEVETDAVDLAGAYERALDLTLDFGFFVNISIAENGVITANIKQASFSNSSLVNSKIPDLNIQNVEHLFDFALGIAIPIVNEKILNNITIPLPTLEGISFTDSTAEVENGFILVNLNPRFN